MRAMRDAMMRWTRWTESERVGTRREKAAALLIGNAAVAMWGGTWWDAAAQGNPGN